MISDALLSRVACPVCLESAGCPACGRAAQDHGTCQAEYDARVRCACGGPEKVRLLPEGDALRCPCCGTAYPVHRADGYVDLVPRTSLGEVTQYADHEFHERLGVTDAPPVLSARVKADMMRRMLAPAAGEPVLDLGCGAGKMALYAGSRGAVAAGVDLAPFFLARAASSVELVLGDLRRLPFRQGAYPRAYSLDVLEHLDEAGVLEVLREARRAIGPDGRLFVYTHAMESSRLASFQRAVNRLARRLGRRGLIDHEREAMRKSDHRNAIRSHEHFEALCAAAGLEVAERRYYNVVAKAVVEDLALRLFEQWKRKARTATDENVERRTQTVERDVSVKVDDNGHEHGRAIEGPRPGRGALAVAHVLTWFLKLDVVLFGGIRTGPFFGLLRPAPPRP
ncbi:MAG TPA: class I SAM-dependent methyltransferase [Vicinamibacteria bacterium]|nr:class I SAM-dependent methyltransferase [Vicinamibacteria bacterium]